MFWIWNDLLRIRNLPLPNHSGFESRTRPDPEKTMRRQNGTISGVYNRVATRLFKFSRAFLMKLTIYAPIIYTAQCRMFWMRAYPLGGQVGGGWALEFESFQGPVKWHRGDRRVSFGAQPPPTCPSNEYARIQTIMHRAVQIIGAQVVSYTRAHPGEAYVCIPA